MDEEKDIFSPPKDSPNKTPRKAFDDLRGTLTMEMSPVRRSGLILKAEIIDYNANDSQYQIWQRRAESACNDYNNLFSLIDGMPRALVLSKVIRTLDPAVAGTEGFTLSTNKFAPTVHTPFAVTYGVNLYVGKTSIIESACVINDTPIHDIWIGERVAIDPGVVITARSTNASDIESIESCAEGKTLCRNMQSSLGDIIIEDDVRIEAGATIVAPCIIGRGTVVKAASTVGGLHLPANRVFAGSPTKDRGRVSNPKEADQAEHSDSVNDEAKAYEGISGYFAHELEGAEPIGASGKFNRGKSNIVSIVKHVYKKRRGMSVG